MDALEISRWQFAVITVYHFFFVPVTLGLSILTAGMQTAWLRTDNPVYLRLTKFFGKLFLINFAIGVVTGIVQEFQFGMNWSDYSRFVGDIFGAPLAMEALLAFFLESTFLGLWIFGWDKLPRKLHAATIWAAAIGTWLSAYFILAANSWMQHPTGYHFNPETGRAELDSIFAVLLNPTQLGTFPHVITAGLLTGGAFMAGVCVWHLAGRKHDGEDREVYRKGVRIGSWVMILAGIGVAISGDVQARLMTEQQPMKMAAAEAAFADTEGLGFSLFTFGSMDGKTDRFSIRIPKLSAFMATTDFNGTVEGITNVSQREQKAYAAKYQQMFGKKPGPAYYNPDTFIPNVPATYWSFRLMIGFGMLGSLVGVFLLLMTRGTKAPGGAFWKWMGPVLVLSPIAGNSFGWIFTELGRQPWVVYGVMTTEQGVSPGVSTTEAAIGFGALLAIYAVLIVVELKLMVTYINKGAPAYVEPPDLTMADVKKKMSDDEPMTFAY